MYVYKYIDYTYFLNTKNTNNLRWRNGSSVHSLFMYIIGRTSLTDGLNLLTEMCA